MKVVDWVNPVEWWGFNYRRFLTFNMQLDVPSSTGLADLNQYWVQWWQVKLLHNKPSHWLTYTCWSATQQDNNWMDPNLTGYVTDYTRHTARRWAAAGQQYPGISKEATYATPLQDPRVVMNSLAGTPDFSDAADTEYDKRVINRIATGNVVGTGDQLGGGASPKTFRGTMFTAVNPWITRSVSGGGSPTPYVWQLDESPLVTGIMGQSTDASLVIEPSGAAFLNWIGTSVAIYGNGVPVTSLYANAFHGTPDITSSTTHWTLPCTGFIGDDDTGEIGNFHVGDVLLMRAGYKVWEGSQAWGPNPSVNPATTYVEKPYVPKYKSISSPLTADATYTVVDAAVMLAVGAGVASSVSTMLF